MTCKHNVRDGDCASCLFQERRGHDSEYEEYDDGFDHGVGCRKRGLPFDRQGVADDATPGSFMDGYRDGWQSTDRLLREVTS